MRGIKEELGLDVEKLESTGTFRFKKRGQLMHGFIASVKSRNLSVPGRLKNSRRILVTLVVSKAAFACPNKILMV